MTPEKITILDNELVTIWCYPSHGILHHQFHKYAFGDSFRKLMMTAAEAFKENQCTKWLSDDRNFGAVLPEDKAWGDEIWLPVVREASWKYWAMVLPKKMTGKMSIQRLVAECAELGVTTQIHDDPNDALSWLLASD